jgi:tetratricopeptide (TPR) repeat protein
MDDGEDITSRLRRLDLKLSGRYLGRPQHYAGQTYAISQIVQQGVFEVEDNELEAARDTFQSALELCNEDPNQGYVHLRMSVLNNLGATYLLQGRAKDAEDCFLASVALSEREDICNYANTAYLSVILGKFARDRGDARSACERWKTARFVYEAYAPFKDKEDKDMLDKLTEWMAEIKCG